VQEELAEGLHLIDFEQLKIENQVPRCEVRPCCCYAMCFQTLSEKIEGRNDELHKLRKKVTATVQVLTHVKEKLKSCTRGSVCTKILARCQVCGAGKRCLVTRASGCGYVGQRTPVCGPIMKLTFGVDPAAGTL